MRETIFKAALQMFADQGFAATSTRAIAAAANLEQGHLAYYFPSKEGLWRETLLFFSADYGDILSGAPKTGEPEEVMIRDGKETLRRIMEGFGNNRLMSSIIYHEFSIRSSRHAWLIDYLVTPTWQALKPLFEFLAQRRRFPISPPHLYYQVVGGAIMFFSTSIEIRKLTDCPVSERSTNEFIDALLASAFDD